MHSLVFFIFYEGNVFELVWLYTFSVSKVTGCVGELSRYSSSVHQSGGSFHDRAIGRGDSIGVGPL